MRTVRLDLELNSTQLRVLCHDPAAGDVLRDVLAEHLVSPDDATVPPVGFVVQAPKPGQSLFVLLDRSGYVLGRTRSGLDCATLLLRHLGVLVDPPSGSTRLRLRALYDQQRDTMVLVGFPLFTIPALTERQIHRSGFAIVDRLVTDLDADLHVVGMPSPWTMAPSTMADADIAGHLACPLDPVPVGGLLLPGNGAKVPTTAQVVAFAAGTALTNDRIAALDIAEHLSSLPALTVPFDSRSARQEGLINLRGG